VSLSKEEIIVLDKVGAFECEEVDDDDEEEGTSLPKRLSMAVVSVFSLKISILCSFVSFSRTEMGLFRFAEGEAPAITADDEEEDDDDEDDEDEDDDNASLCIVRVTDCPSKSIDDVVATPE
jgi:hypothetical protein